MPLLDTALALLAPHRCLQCSMMGRLVCNNCQLDAFLPVPGRCYRCKRLSPDFATCKNCRNKTPLTHVWVRTDYDGVAKQLLYRFKFGRARSAVHIIASEMHDTLPYLATTTIVPVPTATKRVRQRGYDQSVLLAKAISRLGNLPMHTPMRRITQTRQVGASRDQRLKQLEHAFVIHKQIIKGAHVVLVDDVVTTGATLETAAKLLKKAGAKSVAAVVFAQKQK